MSRSPLVVALGGVTREQYSEALAEIARLQKLLQAHGVDSCEDLCLVRCMGPCGG